MNAHGVQKAGIEEWLAAAEVLAERLTECVHVYKHKTDVFMAETERQNKTDRTIKILQKLHALLDQAELPLETMSAAKALDDKLVAGLAPVFRESLGSLPWLSADMQKLLKSPWMKNFPSKSAETIFAAGRDQNEGIGSGSPEHGRLPGILAALLEREIEGETRPARRELSTSPEPRRHDIESTQRWLQQNGGYLRSAGRVD